MQRQSRRIHPQALVNPQRIAIAAGRTVVAIAFGGGLQHKGGTMIELIYAKKGSGKTKRLIDQANAELSTTKGDVVFIDDDKRYIYDVKHQIRFVDVTDYGIDSILKIIGAEADDISEYIDKIEKLTEKNNFKAVISVSADPDTAPAELTKYII